MVRRRHGSRYDAGLTQPQLAFQYFAVRISRQRIDQPNLADALLLAYALIRPFTHLQRGVRGRARARHHDSDRSFTSFFVGQSNHAHLGHQRMRRHHDLDVGGINVLAARENHVLLAIDDVKETVKIRASDIPGA